MRRHTIFAFTAVTAVLLASSLTAQQRPAPVFTHADTLRGSNGAARAWWDVVFYDLHTKVNPSDSTISGWNGIAFRALKPGREMQIDLQMPMVVDSMKSGGRAVKYRRDGNAFFATLPAPMKAGSRNTVTVYYHGR